MLYGARPSSTSSAKRNNRIIRTPAVSTQGKIGHESPNYHSAALPLSHLTEKALGRAQPHDSRFGTAICQAVYAQQSVSPRDLFCDFSIHHTTVRVAELEARSAGMVDQQLEGCAPQLRLLRPRLAGHDAQATHRIDQLAARDFPRAAALRSLRETSEERTGFLVLEGTCPVQYICNTEAHRGTQRETQERGTQRDTHREALHIDSEEVRSHAPRRCCRGVPSAYSGEITDCSSCMAKPEAQGSRVFHSSTRTPSRLSTR